MNNINKKYIPSMKEIWKEFRQGHQEFECGFIENTVSFSLFITLISNFLTQFIYIYLKWSPYFGFNSKEVFWSVVVVNAIVFIAIMSYFIINDMIKAKKRLIGYNLMQGS